VQGCERWHDKNTNHIVRQLGDALNEEPHPFPKGLWVDGTLRSANSGATWGLPWINLQKIERPEQMLWLALLGAQATFPEHQPHLQDNLDACPEETTESAVLHSGRPGTPGRPVLDVPGITKEHGLLRIPVVVIIVGVGVLNGVVAGGSNGDVTHFL